MNFLFETTVKVSLVVIAGLAAAVLRRHSAAVRHWALAAAIACATALPVFTFIVPSWQIDLGVSPAVPATGRSGSAASGASIERPRSADTRVLIVPEVAAPPAALGLSAILWRMWVAGAALNIAMLLLGLTRLAWLSSSARRVDEGMWAEVAAGVCRLFEVRRPVALLQSDHPTLLVTWGVTQPKIILPAAARDWTADRARIVLSHELAHIHRGDWAVQMLGECLRCVYWFNPLIWLACRRLRQESEQACDDAVLNGGVDAAEYATHLVDLAHALNIPRRRWLPASAFARPSSLQRRISAMLNTSLNRTPLTWPARVGTLITLLTLALPLAGFGGQPFSTFSGSVVDQTNGFLPNTTLILTNTRSQARHEVRTDRTGRFEFVGLPAGEYALDVRQLGFAVFTDSVAITGDLDRTIALQVGSLTETITVSADSSGPPRVDAEKLQNLRQQALEFRQRAGERCSAGVLGGGGMGGNILTPKKVTHVRPEYPEHLKAAKIGGVVTMDATIGTDGTVREVRVVSSPHPDLDRAAADAVRLWEFSSTLLNCTPIEVQMHVTTNFVQP